MAMGDCIAARLGYDRSGYAEAVVAGKGMPLFAAHENARRGMGEVEEREQASGEAAKRQAAKAAYTPADVTKLCAALATQPSRSRPNHRARDPTEAALCQGSRPRRYSVERRVLACSGFVTWQCSG